MTNPRDIERPESVELGEFGDEERDDKLIGYVTFIVDTTAEFDETEVREFKNRLREECDSWEVQDGRVEDGTYKIFLRKVHVDFSEQEPPEEYIEEQNEQLAERYKEEYQNEYQDE